MLTPWPPLTRGLAAQLTGGEIVPYFPETYGIIETFSLPPALRATSLIRGRLGFLLPFTPVNPSSEGGLGFRSFKGFSSRGRLFQSVRAADTSPIHYSLFSLIYYLTPPLAPSDDTGFRHPPLAPTDEGAGSAADWGREPGFVFPQRR